MSIGTLKPRRKPRLFERLEQRAMLAGDVDVSVALNGRLDITGDAAANVITIQQTGATEWTVTGLGTLINGAAGAFVATDVTGGIAVNMDSGNNVVRFSGNVGGNLLLDFGSGSDALYVTNTIVDNMIRVRMGAGNDSLVVSNVSVGDLVYGTRVYMGAGSDALIVTNLTSTRGRFDLEAGNDLMTMTSADFSADVVIHGRSGTNRVALVDVAIELESEEWLFVDMGDGSNDVLSVTGSSGTRAVLRGGGGSNNTLVALNNEFDVETITGFQNEV